MVGKLTELSIKSERLSKEVTPNHPTLKVANQEIETARTVLLENISSLKEATKVSLNNSLKRLNSYTYELNKLPNKEQKLLNFQRKYSLTESNFVFLMQKRYEADISVAKVTIEIYLNKSVGIGEHPQFVQEIDKQLEAIASAEDKLNMIEKHYPNDDDIPF